MGGAGWRELSAVCQGAQGAWVGRPPAGRKAGRHNERDGLARSNALPGCVKSCAVKAGSGHPMPTPTPADIHLSAPARDARQRSGARIGLLSNILQHSLKAWMAAVRESFWLEERRSFKAYSV